MIIDISRLSGLPEYETAQLVQLLEVFDAHETKNKTKDLYYEGDISLNSVNLGIALPDNISGLKIGCAWGAKTVDVLAARSMFDGYVGEDGESMIELERIASANQLLAAYPRAARDELKFGCDFATLSADPAIGCKIRFHSPRSAAALWNGDKGRIDCGFAIIDYRKVSRDKVAPSLVYFYTDTALWILRRDSQDYWTADPQWHQMGRPLMEPLIWNATHSKPLGRSRLKAPIRYLIDGYVRTVANATLGLEFATSPQKYILGVTDEQYDAIVNQKFKQYIGSIIASTTNPETGEKPTFGQLVQGNISPHVEMLRILATQFSAATGLTVTDTGVVNDANPTSSDAILAQSQTLIMMAEELNKGNGNALQTIAQMALAISRQIPMSDLTDTDRAIIPHFKNPAMPSIAMSADAAIKIATSRPNFAGTDVYLEMLGFSQADIRRIKAQELRSRGLSVLEELGE